MAPGIVLADALAELTAAHRRMEARVGALRPGQERSPSRLPSWSRGHLLTHLARNADSMVRRIEGARRGEAVEQYAHGAAGRAADIEAGASRSLAALLDDLHESTAALDAAWPTDLEDPAWAVRSRDLGGTERPASELPLRRWQEVEVHLVDLDAGVTPRDWPERFVATFLPAMRAGLPGRLPAGTVLPDPLPCPPVEELAWLYGRLAVPGLPVLAGW